MAALRKAYDHYQHPKWEIISNKMLDYGIDQKWPPKYCVRKFEELHPGLDLSAERAASVTGTSDAD